jgi:tetraacyldisaccharide 4'-kinase
VASAGRIESALARVWWRDAPGVAAWALWPLTLCYRVLSSLRRTAYAIGGLRSERAAVPVIVVGNLVVGGAG